MQHQPRKPRIFIVYQKAERQLADRIWELYEAWGCQPFHCRHDDIDKNEYREKLRTNIRASDLVVLLLSREFRWSEYCQAEAGTAIALAKPFIAIVVPPAFKKDVGAIAPVLEGLEYVSLDDHDFVSTLRDKTVARLREGREAFTEMRTLFETLENQELTPLRECSLRTKRTKNAEIGAAVEAIGAAYALSHPPRDHVASWGSLESPHCVESIVGNIRQSLESPSPKTSLTFVGVSLKFSLRLISDALQGVSRERKGQRRLNKKTLTITLVHMDGQSHILHAMNVQDTVIIRSNFERDWMKIKRGWDKACRRAAIVPSEPLVHRIDYLPPRVGILIDESILFAGRCAFERRGKADAFELRVGELEYLFYKRNGKLDASDDNARKAIAEFQGFVKAYSHKKNNVGLTPLTDSDEWMGRLRQYIESSEDRIREVTFISATATKFLPLIIRLLREHKKATIRVFVHDSGTSSSHVDNVKTRIKHNLERLPKNLTVASYRHAATVRAIVIDDVLIALQPYINEDESSRGRKGALPLCVIVTKCFEHFEKLKRDVFAIVK